MTTKKSKVKKLPKPNKKPVCIWCEIDKHIVDWTIPVWLCETCKPIFDEIE